MEGGAPERRPWPRARPTRPGGGRWTWRRQRRATWHSAPRRGPRAAPRRAPSPLATRRRANRAVCRPTRASRASQARTHVAAEDPARDGLARRPSGTRLNPDELDSPTWGRTARQHAARRGQRRDEHAPVVTELEQVGWSANTHLHLAEAVFDDGRAHQRPVGPATRWVAHTVVLSPDPHVAVQAQVLDRRLLPDDAKEEAAGVVRRQASSVRREDTNRRPRRPRAFERRFHVRDRATYPVEQARSADGGVAERRDEVGVVEARRVQRRSVREPGRLARVGPPSAARRQPQARSGKVRHSL